MGLVHQVAVTLSGSGALAVIAVVVALWIASMGAAWKVATILSSIANELKDLRTETQANAANIATLQRRFDVPQAEVPA